MNLTRRSYFIVAIVVLLGIVSQWIWPELATLWRLLAAALLLGLTIEGLLARNITLSLHRQFPEAAYLGSPLHYQLQVKNPLDLTLTLRSMDTLPDEITESPQVIYWKIPSLQSHSQTITVTPRHLGQLRWSTIQLRVLGRFGLTWWNRQYSLIDEITVFPDRLRKREYRKTATEHQGDISRHVTGTGHELLGMREYQYGDPLHFIDWKATARCRKPIVRLFSDEQHLELILAIDAGRTSRMQAGDLTRLGHYTNVAARLGEKAMHNGDQVSLVVFADQVIHASKGLRGHKGLQHLRHTLQNMQSIPRESNPLSAILEIRTLARHRSLVVLLTDLDDGEAANQLVKAMSLLRPKHQPVLAAISDQETLKLQQQESEDWSAPFHSLAASEMIQNWEHTQYRLQRMGIPVILAGTRYLDQQVLASYDQMKIRHRI